MAEGKAGAEDIVDPGGMPPGIAAAPVLIGGGMLICPAAPATSYNQLKFIQASTKALRRTLQLFAREQKSCW